MNPFEKALLNDIPMDEAADFFVRVTNRDKLAQAEVLDTVRARGEALLKKANAMAMPGVPGMGGGGMKPPAPIAAPAAPMLSPSAQGQNNVKMGSKKKEPAPTVVKEKKAPLAHRAGEHVGRHIDTIGGVAGGLQGAGTGYIASRAVQALRGTGHGAGGKAVRLGATLAGAVAGAGLGRAAGRFTQGMEAGAGAAHKKVYQHHKEAMLRAASKLAFDGAGGAPPPSDPNEEPSLQEYMANEQAGQQAEEQQGTEYFKQRFQQASQQLQETQAQASQTQEQADQLQQQVAQSDQQVQAAMQQAQMASQSAQQNVQQAHQMAMDATSQAMQSQAEVLKQKQLAAAMRMGVQTLKDNVMGAMANDPTEQLAQQLTAPPPGSAGVVGASGVAQPPQVDPATGQPVQDPAMAGQDPNAAAAGGAPPGADPAAAGGAAPAEGGGESKPKPKEKSDGEKSEKKDDSKKDDKKGGGTEVTVKHSAARFLALAEQFRKVG